VFVGISKKPEQHYNNVEGIAAMQIDDNDL